MPRTNFHSPCFPRMVPNLKECGHVGDHKRSRDRSRSRHVCALTLQLRLPLRRWQAGRNAKRDVVYVTKILGFRSAWGCGYAQDATAYASYKKWDRERLGPEMVPIQIQSSTCMARLWFLHRVKYDCFGTANVPWDRKWSQFKFNHGVHVNVHAYIYVFGQKNG